MNLEAKFVSSDKLYQVDFVYEFSETLYRKRIEAFDYIELMKQVEENFNIFSENNPRIINAKIFFGKEKIIIKQKVVEQLNRRKNG